METRNAIVNRDNPTNYIVHEEVSDNIRFLVEAMLEVFEEKYDIKLGLEIKRDLKP